MIKFLPALLLIPLSAQTIVRPVFNGKDLEGWEQHGAHPSFFTANSELRTSGKGHAGNWIHTTREYENFRLRFDYKLEQWAEAAIVLRAPRTHRPQHAGLAIVLAHDFHNETTPWITGAIMGVTPPAKALPASFDQWHNVEIDLRGSRLRVTIDKELLQDTDLALNPALANRLRSGVIGFTDMGHAYAVRNVELEEFPSRTNYVNLIPADTLSGWDKRGDSGEWRLQNGVIQGLNGHSILYPLGTFGDFELTTLVRTHSRVNAGIFLRGQPDGPNRGFEVQIYSPVDAVYQTGSVYGRRRSALDTDLEGRWFLMQIRVQGPRCTVWIDGREVSDFPYLPATLFEPGRIGLQIHSGDGMVEFRDLRVRTP